MYVISARFTTGVTWREELADWARAGQLAAKWREAGASVKVRFYPSLSENVR